MITHINAADLLDYGREWSTDRYHRIYINDLPTLYGLKVTRYKTGNISSATLDGERISNGHASKLLTSLELGKLWWDYADQQFHAHGMSEQMMSVLIEALEARLSSHEPGASV